MCIRIQKKYIFEKVTLRECPFCKFFWESKKDTKYSFEQFSEVPIQVSVPLPIFLSAPPRLAAKLRLNMAVSDACSTRKDDDDHRFLSVPPYVTMEAMNWRWNALLFFPLKTETKGRNKLSSCRVSWVRGRGHSMIIPRQILCYYDEQGNLFPVDIVILDSRLISLRSCKAL